MPPTRPGRPRSREADQRILEAAAELLTERGLTGTSIEAVARRAGVAKTTIYRRWPNLAALATAAMNHHLRTPLAITGDLRADLVAYAEHWVHTLRHPIGRDMILAFLHPDGAPRALRDALRQQRHTMMAELLSAAGEAANYHPERLNDLLGGTILYKILAWKHLPETELEALVHAALRGARVTGESTTGLHTPKGTTSPT